MSIGADGSVRRVCYSTGNWPAAGSSTGEWADGPTGLNDDVARSYDTGVGQFASADPVNAGLDRSAYVGDNPETLTDPSGHCAMTYSPGGGANIVCRGGGGDGGNGNNGNNSPSNPNPLTPHPTPVPVPCANAQNQCTNPPPTGDELYDSLRQDAWKAEAALWNLIDQLDRVYQVLESFLTQFPDLSGGRLFNLLSGLRRAIDFLKGVKQEYFLRRNWSDQQWTLRNLVAFDAQTTAGVDAAVALNGFEVAMWGTPNPIGIGFVAYYAPLALAEGEVVGVQTTTMTREYVDIAGCLPFCI